ncbi:MAG: amidohydrolase family protein [Patescibacteria group bacterium]
MKIIDAHIHVNFSNPEAKEFTEKEGIPWSWNVLLGEMEKNRIAGAMAITTDTESPTPGESDILLDLRERDTRFFPVPAIHPKHTGANDIKKTEILLKERKIFGFKIFPGYHPVYPSDPCYHPFYELAGRFGVPVIIHTGDTFGSKYLVKFSHPLDVDEIAVKFPGTTFVLAHLGNPWVRDAAELVYKNENVYADFSAFCMLHVGVNDKKRIREDITFALQYTGRPDKFLYGSDWPLVNMGEYIALIKALVPRRFHQKIFFDNANHIFKLGL